ncbi:transporter [Psychroserpens algicola]|uniref:Transporter n=1 Tax=Psychroserpens algicola TaxID=1719034 RepID=A0ABT0H9D0_9FLAO|nr:transporter [Psychroserpens algicola]MCK8480430.1 transporter [Psychroserpens algicola]
MKKIIIFLVTLSLSFSGFSQEESNQEKSVIQEYTPSKLLNKGQWDIKWFNNLYTQTESTFSEGTEPRQTFFTSTVDIFTGISNSSNFNIGLLLEFRSNVINDRNALDVFAFDGESGTARSGFTSFAPAVKFNPIKSISNFTIQTAFHIPLVDNETENGVFLDQKGFIFQNRFFYDYTFPGDKWQVFTELNTEYNFGKKEDSFANNSLSLTPGVFLSYFPSQKFTILGLIQHSQRIDTGNDFEQDFTAVGGGAKYQLTKVLNIETLYTNFVRGNNTGLGQTFNIGLRALF